MAFQVGKRESQNAYITHTTSICFISWLGVVNERFVELGLKRAGVVLENSNIVLNVIRRYRFFPVTRFTDDGNWSCFPSHNGEWFFYDNATQRPRRSPIESPRYCRKSSAPSGRIVEAAFRSRVAPFHGPLGPCWFRDAERQHVLLILWGKAM